MCSPFLTEVFVLKFGLEFTVSPSPAIGFAAALSRHVRFCRGSVSTHGTMSRYAASARSRSPARRMKPLVSGGLHSGEEVTFNFHVFLSWLSLTCKVCFAVSGATCAAGTGRPNDRAGHYWLFTGTYPTTGRATNQAPFTKQTVFPGTTSVVLLNTDLSCDVFEVGVQSWRTRCPSQDTQRPGSTRILPNQLEVLTNFNWFVSLASQSLISWRLFSQHRVNCPTSCRHLREGSHETTRLCECKCGSRDTQFNEG